MDEEYQRTRKYIENDLSFDVDGDLNAFETTIRVLGGLLSAYHLAGNDTLYLNKAIDLGTRLLPIFDSVRFFLIRRAQVSYQSCPLILHFQSSMSSLFPQN
jgi:hypothetical protein